VLTIDSDGGAADFIFDGGKHFIMPQVNDAVTPTLTFTDSDTGFYQGANNEINVAVAGANDWDFSINYFTANTAGGAWMWDGTPTTAIPVMGPSNSDPNTGLSTAGADTLSMVAGADEAWRFEEGAYSTSAGDSVAWVSDVVTAPTSNPTGGVLLYSDADDLFIRDTGGTVTNLTTGGSATWEGLTNSADSATSYVSDNTAETVTFDFQSDFTGSQFVIKQTTGNPTTGVLFDIEVADANVKAFQATDSAGDGVELSISGNLVVVGSGNIDASRVNYDGDVIAEITSNGTNIQFDPNDDSSTNWIMTTSALQGFTAGAASVANLDSTATVPNILSDKTDTNTGMGASAADQISLIADLAHRRGRGNPADLRCG
jgi:hypothetical protein